MELFEKEADRWFDYFMHPRLAVLSAVKPLLLDQKHKDAMDILEPDHVKRIKLGQDGTPEFEPEKL